MSKENLPSIGLEQRVSKTKRFILYFDAQSVLCFKLCKHNKGGESLCNSVAPIPPFQPYSTTLYSLFSSFPNKPVVRRYTHLNLLCFRSNILRFERVGNPTIFKGPRRLETVSPGIRNTGYVTGRRLKTTRRGHWITS